VPALPKARETRKDPEPRPVSGVPYGGIEVLNKDPNRWYALIHAGSGSGAETICPEIYEEKGYIVEMWPTFEGLEGEKLKAAELNGLRFAGTRRGRPGEPMMTRGHVLMSIDLESRREEIRAGQESVDPIEAGILGDNATDAYLQAARQGIQERPRARAFGIEKWE
jgi:hypothetical protein